MLFRSRQFHPKMAGFSKDLPCPNSFGISRRYAAENYTNRSPYPMLHLLRETSVAQATDASDEVLEIPRRNIETMRNLGREHILKRLKTLNAEH